MALEYADRVIGMRAGEVVFDGPASGMSEATFEEIYGRKIRPDDLRSQNPALELEPTMHHSHGPVMEAALVA